MTTGNFNYTGRKKIKNNAVLLQITERTDEYVRVTIELDRKLLQQYEKSNLVLDAFDRSTHSRSALDCSLKQEVVFNDFHKDAKLKFKIKSVSTSEDSKGKILAATTEIRPREKSTKIQRDVFINPIPRDIGGIPWMVDWEGDEANPEIIINSRLHSHYEDWRNPALQALFLPQILKELLLGIVTRSSAKDDIEEDSLAGKLLLFCWERLELEKLDVEFIEEGRINTQWLNWVDEAVEQFSEIRWRDNMTLLDQMVGEGQ